MGWPVEIAPIGVDAQMRFWIWIDSELAGSEAESGFHPPSEIELVLRQNVAAIFSWFEIHATEGIEGRLSWNEVSEAARKLLRAISTGRARSRSEHRESMREERRNTKKSGMLKRPEK